MNIPEEKGSVRVRIELESRSPGMLFQAMSEAKLAEIFTGGGKKPDRVPFEELVYRNSAGGLVLPADNIMACLVEAGRGLQYERRANLSTLDSSLVPGLIEIEADEMVLRDWDGNIPALIPQKLPAGDWARPKTFFFLPRIRNWRGEIVISFNRNDIAESKVRELFEKAGKEIGFGYGNKPKKQVKGGPNRGRFGNFVVLTWDVETGASKAA